LHGLRLPMMITADTVLLMDEPSLIRQRRIFRRVSPVRLSRKVHAGDVEEHLLPVHENEVSFV
jgi:hypothetical protein